MGCGPGTGRGLQALPRSPAQHVGARGCPAPGGWRPRSTCTPGLSLGAAVYPQRSLLSPAPAPRRERQSHGFPRAWSPLRPSLGVPALGGHWEDPAPSWDAWFPLVPGHLSQRSLTLAPPEPPRTPAPRTPSSTQGIYAPSGGDTEHLGAPAPASSAADSCPFPGASRGAGAAPLLLPAEPPRSHRGCCRRAPLPRSPGAADAMHPRPVPWGAGSWPPVLSIPPGPGCSPRRRPNPAAAQQNLVSKALSYLGAEQGRLGAAGGRGGGGSPCLLASSAVLLC